MKQTDYNTTAIAGRIHPHDHKHSEFGPYDLFIGERNLPEFLHDWPSSANSRPTVYIEQPNENDNFTLVKVLFLKSGVKKPWPVAGLTMKRTRFYRKKKGLKVTIRKRLTDAIPHPLPTGKYTGNCVYDVEGRFAAFTFQAVTLRKQPEPQKPKTIVTPGDKAYGDTLANLKKAFPDNDGLGRGRISPG